MRLIKYILFVAPLIVMLSSCGVAVKMCKAPQLNIPSEIVEGQLDSLTIADMRWWEFYGDDVLGGFISHALENNKDILVAAARVEQMRV